MNTDWSLSLDEQILFEIEEIKKYWNLAFVEEIREDIEILSDKECTLLALRHYNMYLDEYRNKLPFEE